MGFATRGITTKDLLEVFPVFKWDAVESKFYTVAGTWAQHGNPLAYLGVEVWNTLTPAINDVIGLGSFYAPLATAYTIYLRAKQDTDYGIIHVFIDDVDVAQIDMYGAFTNNVPKSASIGALTIGLKRIKFKIDSKNGSSTDYRCDFQTVLINPS